jgi:hypothetical protein
VVHQNPAGTDPLPTGRKTTATTEAHSRMHGRVLDLWENVLAHGADPTGTDDSAAAIQAAIDAAESTYGTVYVPTGIYKVGTELVMDTNGTTLIGTGVRGLGASGLGVGAGPVIQAASGSALRSVLRLSAAHCAVRDVIIDGNDTAEAGLLFHNAGRGEIDRVYTVNCTVGGFLWDITQTALSNGNNNSMVLTKCVATGNSGSGFSCPAWQSDNNAIQLVACTASNNTLYGMNLCGGFLVQGGHVESNDLYGIKVGSASDGTTTVGTNILYTHMEGNTSGGILADKCARVMYHRPLSSGQTVDFTNSATPTGVMELLSTGDSYRFKYGANGRSIELKPNGSEIELASDAVENLDLTLTPFGTGRITTPAEIHTAGELEVDGALNHDGTTVGFYGVTPATRPTAYTQTYSTASKTHAALTVGADIAAFTDPPSAAEMALLRTFVNALKADLTNVKQVLNSVIDDDQILGLKQ